MDTGQSNAGIIQGGTSIPSRLWGGGGGGEEQGEGVVVTFLSWFMQQKPETGLTLDRACSPAQSTLPEYD